MLLQSLYPIPENIPRLDSTQVQTFASPVRFSRVLAGTGVVEESGWGLITTGMKSTGIIQVAGVATLSSTANVFGGFSVTGNALFSGNSLIVRADGNTYISYQNAAGQIDTQLIVNRGAKGFIIRNYSTLGGGSYTDFALNAATGALLWGANNIYHSGNFDYTTFLVTGNAGRLRDLTLHSYSTGGSLRWMDPANPTVGAGLRYFMVSNDTSLNINTANDDGSWRKNRFNVPRDSSLPVQIDSNTVWHAGNVPSPANLTTAQNITGAWSFINTGTVGTAQFAGATIPFSLTGVGPSSANFSVNASTQREVAGSTADTLSLTLRSSYGSSNGALVKWYQDQLRLASGSTGSSIFISDGGLNFTGVPTFFSGLVSRVFAPGTQMIFHSIGWNNGVQRWAQVMEATGAYVWYSYNSTGGNPTSVLSMTNPANGLGGTTPGIGVAGQIYVTQGVQAPNWGFTTSLAHLASYMATGSYGGGYMCQDNAGSGTYYGGMYAASGWIGIGLTAANSTGLNKVLRLTQEQYMTVQTEGGFAARGGSAAMIVEERTSTNVQWHMYATSGSFRIWDNVSGRDNISIPRNTGDLYISAWGYAANFAINSDQRVKTWIADLDPEEELHKLLSMPARLYTKDGKLESGVYAQDVQARWAHMVNVNNEMNPYGIDGLLTVSHNMLQAPMIASIQALYAHIKHLEQEVERLKTQG